jgi:Cof subfamily protein (haloacid dehalogenase superfamily)
VEDRRAGTRAVSGVTEALDRPAPPAIADLAVDTVPKAVALDIDGTLIDINLRLHPRTRAAVRAAANRVPVVLATGRMYQSTLPWARELEVSQPLICYQGALVRQQPEPVGDGSVILEVGLDGSVARRAVEIAHDGGWHVQAYIDDQLLCDEDRPEGRLYSRIAGVRITFVDDLAEVVAGGSTKVVIVSEDPAVTDAAVSTYGEVFGPRARVTRSLEQFVEVVNPAVSKAIALGIVLERLGLRLSDAVAVGDAGNDAEMLAAAAVGVVVRGARANVLASADAVCSGPDQAGVADVLEHVGLA